MASSLAAPVTALQVGTFFVTQYYHVLQNQPEYAHQFYTDLSTMSRTDRDKQETATGMMEIHNRVMSQNYTSGPLEVKSVDAQESLNGGLLVMVTGCVQRNNMEGKRNFVQTFFLAPQEKGFYVLNDIFRFFEDDLYVQKPTDVMTNGDHEPQLKSAVTEPGNLFGRQYCCKKEVSGFAALEAPAFAGAEITREFTPEEEAVVEEYDLPEHQELSESEEKYEEAPPETTTAAAAAVIPSPESAPVSAPAPAEEASGEVPKHTYASILRVAKTQAHSSTATTSYQAPLNKAVAVVAERQPAQQPVPQQPQAVLASTGAEEADPEASDDIAGTENEGDGRSIYIKNLPSTVMMSEVETEFNKFGKIKSGGVNIVNRKDFGVCYAFIEFEDTSSVQSAVGASPLPFGGRHIYVEEKRTTSSGSRGRRGRGRGFQNEGSRGRGYYGARPYGRGSGQDFGREYLNRGRSSGSRGGYGTGGANGFQQTDSRQGNSLRQPRRAGGNQMSHNSANAEKTFE
eukprot:Gb_32671 [translate_table: standard]